MCAFQHTKIPRKYIEDHAKKKVGKAEAIGIRDTVRQLGERSSWIGELNLPSVVYINWKMHRFEIPVYK
jgi:hypothetical protein